MSPAYHKHTRPGHLRSARLSGPHARLQTCARVFAHSHARALRIRTTTDAQSHTPRHTRAYTRIHKYADTHTHSLLHKREDISHSFSHTWCKYTRVHTYHARACAHVSAPPHGHWCLHAYTFMCVCVCIDIYTYTYIHTCIHT